MTESPSPARSSSPCIAADASLRLTARTDAQGAFSLDLPRAGVWLIKSVHMVRTSFWSFSDADWISLWASLTFEVPEARP